METHVAALVKVGATKIVTYRLHWQIQSVGNLMDCTLGKLAL